jgi:integrase
MTVRKIQDSKLDSRKAREKLKARGMPYYRKIEGGLAVGYRRLRRGQAGTWWCRHYVGEKQYDVERLGTADDLIDAFANGVTDNHTLKLLEAVADPVLTFDQAQAVARARKGKRATGVTGPLTVKDAVEQYLERLDGQGSKSIDDARYRAAAFIFPAKIATVECNKLTADDLHKWKAKLAKEAPRKRTKKDGKQKQQHRDFDPDDAEAVRRRQATANRVLTIIKAALNQAWRDEKVSTDKAWRSVKPFEDVDAARVRYLEVAEARRLINASDPVFRPLVQAALVTGARYGELTRLTAADFHVHKQRKKNDNVADVGTIAIQQSKSGKARHVVLTEEGIALFRQLSFGRAGSDLLIHKSNGSVWEKSNQARPMKEACARAKIMPPISFHGLRHTYASHAVMNGVPLLVVAKNLGHSDTRMVEKHYGHLAPSYIADAIREGAPRFGFEPDSKVSYIGSST